MATPRKRTVTKKRPPKGKRAVKKRRTAKRSAGGLSEVIGRALTDKEFRDLLFNNRSKAIQGFQLSRGDRVSLERLSREEIEAQAERLGGLTSLAVRVVIGIPRVR
jgi:Fic family protein